MATALVQTKMIAKPMAYVILEIIVRVYVVYDDVLEVLRGGRVNLAIYRQFKASYWARGSLQ